jgi:uncharacterized protein YbcV (DUF1398 family)
MSAALLNFQAAQREATASLPTLQGFPYLAETLRRAGVRTNTWWLPSMQSLYMTNLGPVLIQGEPLIDGMSDVAPFDRDALIDALRANQAGETTFPEFAGAAWRAGVLHYVVDLDGRTCSYFGVHNESWVERYPAVSWHPASGRTAVTQTAQQNGLG